MNLWVARVAKRRLCLCLLLDECITVKYRDTPVCFILSCARIRRRAVSFPLSADHTAKSYMLIKLNNTWYHYCSVHLAPDGSPPSRTSMIGRQAMPQSALPEPGDQCTGRLIAGITRAGSSVTLRDQLTPWPAETDAYRLFVL